MPDEFTNACPLCGKDKYKYHLDCGCAGKRELERQRAEDAKHQFSFVFDGVRIHGDDRLDGDE